MSIFYITPTEGTTGTSISVNRFNELAKNHPSSSVTSNTMPNSKISNLGNIYNQYLFSKKINVLNKKPLKWSDFNTSAFLKLKVKIKGESPAQYGTNNDGKITVIAQGGTGSSFNIKIGVHRGSVANKNFKSVVTYVDSNVSATNNSAEVNTSKNLNSGYDLGVHHGRKYYLAYYDIRYYVSVEDQGLTKELTKEGIQFIFIIDNLIVHWGTNTIETEYYFDRTKI